MKELIQEIKNCTICAENLPLGPRPVFVVDKKSKILIVGQAPGTKVHQSGIPWDDQSGKRLRKWMNVDDATFYNPELFGIVPMGFCYPGKGKSGDLPPRKECAPQWHDLLIEQMPDLQLTLLIGQYAQNYYLKDKAKKNLTTTVENFEDYLPNFFVLPHPSPRNTFWLRRNPWFEESVIPLLQSKIAQILD